jgi:hypothetical protein
VKVIKIRQSQLRTDMPVVVRSVDTAVVMMSCKL